MTAQLLDLPWPSEHAEPIQREIHAVVDHELFRHLNSLDAVRVFMEHHVWCVWDFMCLAKSLQLGLTSMVPWFPSVHPQALAKLYDILLSEETDVGPDGSCRSHFEEFVIAMHSAGADTGPIEGFIQDLRQGHDPRESMRARGAPESAIEFVEVTFKHANAAPHVRAAAFCAGREALVPHMLLELRRNVRWERSELERLRWYVDRHVELDFGSHGAASVSILHALVGDSVTRLLEAAEAAFEAVTARLKFLDELMKRV